MKWSLFLDDERFPPRSLVDDWHIARTATEARFLIHRNGMPHRMSLDHDLGHNEETGYDFIKWLVNQDMDNKLNIHETTHFYVHSQNPVGKKNIEMYYQNYMDSNS